MSEHLSDHELNKLALLEQAISGRDAVATRIDHLLAGARRIARLSWDPVNGPLHRKYEDGEPAQSFVIYNDGPTDCYVGETNVNLIAGSSNTLITVKSGMWVTLPIVTARLYVSGAAAGSVLVLALDHAVPPASGFLNGLVGTSASGVTDDGSNPIKVGGTYHLAPITYVDGQRFELQSDNHGWQRVTLGSSGVGTTCLVPGDGMTFGNGALGAAAIQTLYTGVNYQVARTPTIFKIIASVSITAGTPVTIWTPQSGKKFRLMGYSLSLGTAATLLLKDSGTEIYRPGTGQPTIFTSPPMGNGILSAAANNVLQADVGSGTATLLGTVYGTEE